MSLQSITYPRRIALVHDWLVTYGGAETVLAYLMGLFPDAPIYTLLYDPTHLPPLFHNRRIIPSWLQHWPQAPQHHRAFLPLMPWAVEQWNFDAYELVISSSHACAKGIVTGPKTCHLSYIHTPMRYAWDWSLYAPSLSRLKNLLVQPLLYGLRHWDQHNTARIDGLACNSTYVQQRIRTYYGREATVIYPPVEIPRFTKSRQKGDFFLMVSRLVPYKRVDIAIAAFNQLGWPLYIIGEGPEMQKLRQMAQPNITFFGWLPDAERQALYHQAKALIFPGIEDFGIVPVEAIAAGCPVVACGYGGATETVLDGQTGWHFWPQTPAALVETLRTIPHFDLPLAPMQAHVQQFSATQFEHQFQDFVHTQWLSFVANQGRSKT